MTEKEFETYWAQNRLSILESNADYRQACEELKMRSGADWLLFAIPVAVGVAVMSSLPIEREILKWLIGAAATIVCFAVCVWVKNAISGTRYPNEIEEKIKARKKEEMGVED